MSDRHDERRMGAEDAEEAQMIESLFGRGAHAIIAGEQPADEEAQIESLVGPPGANALTGAGVVRALGHETGALDAPVAEQAEDEEAQIIEQLTGEPPPDPLSTEPREVRRLGEAGP